MPDIHTLLIDNQPLSIKRCHGGLPAETATSKRPAEDQERLLRSIWRDTPKGREQVANPMPRDAAEHGAICIHELMAHVQEWHSGHLPKDEVDVILASPHVHVDNAARTKRHPHVEHGGYHDKGD